MRDLIPVFALVAVRVAREPNEREFGGTLSGGRNAWKVNRPVEPAPEVVGGAAEKVE
jgi:hypothetical protein